MTLLTSNYTTQINEVLSKLLDSGIDLGWRILGAIVIFLVGKLIVNWANKLFAKLLVKQKVEPGVQTFLKSLVNILLLIMLGLAVIGKLGIELTGFAALLASAGVAVTVIVNFSFVTSCAGLFSNVAVTFT